MVKRAAQVVSIVFHPLLLSTYLVLVLGYFFPGLLKIDQRKLTYVAAFVFVFTFLMPVINLIMLRSFKTIRSLTLDSREERLFPFTLITIIYGLVAFLFYYKLPFSNDFNKLMFIIFVLVLASLIFTFFFKISIHSIAMAGGVGILLPLNKAQDEPTLLLPTVVLIALAGLVMSARLVLGAHTLREVLHGALVGFVIGFSGIMLLF